MAYIRPQPKQRISKEERKQLLQEYYLHYKELRACLETHLSIMKRFNSMLAMAI